MKSIEIANKIYEWLLINECNKTFIVQIKWVTQITTIDNALSIIVEWMKVHGVESFEDFEEIPKMWD